jgi:hypothetical protein
MNAISSSRGYIVRGTVNDTYIQSFYLLFFQYVKSVRPILKKIFILFNTASSAAPLIPLCDRMLELGLNQCDDVRIDCQGLQSLDYISSIYVMQ